MNIYPTFMQELKLVLFLLHCPEQCPSLTACKEHPCQTVPLGILHSSCLVLALFPRPVTVSKLCTQGWTILGRCQGKCWLPMYLYHHLSSQVCHEVGETVFPQGIDFFLCQIGVSYMYLPPGQREQQVSEVSTMPPLREGAGTFWTC